MGAFVRNLAVEPLDLAVVDEVAVFITPQAERARQLNAAATEDRS